MSASTSVLLVICCTMVAGNCTSVMITWLGLGARVSARARAKARVRVRARARVRACPAACPPYGTLGLW